MKITTNGLGFLIGDFLLPYYGLMILVGAVVAVIIGFFLVKHHKKNIDIFIVLATSGLFGGLVGAKLLYILISWKEIDFTNFSGMLQSGFVFYGGVLGALAVLLLINRFTKIEVFPYVQICISCVPIAHGFGRIGCHLVGCCYGIDYDGWGAKKYTDSYVPGLNGREVFPIQLTEAVALFVLGIILIIYVWKSEKPTYTLSIYLAAYSILRFGLEFLRGDDGERKVYWLFSTSQWISVLLVVGMMIVYIAKRRKNGVHSG